jgi:hypothetical protein
MKHHTDRDAAVFDVARLLLSRLWRRSRRVRLVGVGLTDLRPARSVQSWLFDDAGRSRRLGRCLDSIRDRFGFSAVQRGLSINLAASDTNTACGPNLPAPART